MEYSGLHNCDVLLLDNYLGRCRDNRKWGLKEGQNRCRHRRGRSESQLIESFPCVEATALGNIHKGSPDFGALSANILAKTQDNNHSPVFIFLSFRNCTNPTAYRFVEAALCQD